MQRRYIKNKASGNIILSMDENELPVENATEFLTSRELSPSDFEIGLTSEEELNQWIVEQDESAKTYADKRRAEYNQLNQFEMQFDDDRDSTTTWVDKINEIKGRHPK